MKIIWLASYPRSGNTYLRFLLYSYVYGIISESMQVETAIPDIHKLIASGRTLNSAIERTVFCKPHFIFSDNHPFLNETTAFLYIIRNPKDVLISNIRYFKLISGQEIDKRQVALDFIRNLGVERWIKMNMGSWPQHISSWLMATNRYPHLFIKYEQLRSDPYMIFKKIINFLNLEIDENKINKTIYNCSIGNMRDMERQEKGEHKATLFGGINKREKFVGTGCTNQSLSQVGDDIEAFFNNKFGKLTSIFVY